jgi:hypothetical protein
MSTSTSTPASWRRRSESAAAFTSAFLALPSLRPIQPHRREEKPLSNTSEAGRRTLTGKCLCGVVQYEVADEFEYAANCHCSDCRRATGSAFKPFAGIRREKFALTAGADTLLIYGDENASHDARCRQCGSFLYSVVRENAYVHVVMGTLVDAPTIRPDHHIFVGSKAPWFTIADDLPQYQRHVGEAEPLDP